MGVAEEHIARTRIDKIVEGGAASVVRADLGTSA
jgi:hypothetical protein